MGSDRKSVARDKGLAAEAAPGAPELIAFPLASGGALPRLQPAPRIRQWQKDSPSAFAARCLPLNIANNNGWELLLPGGFDAVYSGADGLSAITIHAHNDGPCIASSHFGVGMLTLFTGYLFRTSADIHLRIGGPENVFRDGIQALSGILETDWSPYNATMNYRFTRSGRVRFRKGEPFAQIFPLPATYVNDFSVRFGNLAKDEPETSEDLGVWARSRQKFNADLHDGCPEATKQKWQKLYYRGYYPDGERKHPEHTIRLNPAAFSQSGLPPQPADPSRTESATGPTPSTGLQMMSGLLRASQVDWRLSRAIDELASRLDDVIVFHPPELEGLAALRADTAYVNVRFLALPADNPVALLKAECRHEKVLTVASDYLLTGEFWGNLYKYFRLLDEKYEAIRLGQFKSRRGFHTSQELDAALACPSDLLEPLHTTTIVLSRREALGEENPSTFLARDRLIWA